MLVIQDLSKEYGGQVLFTDVNLRLDPGKVYGIVGANGSGKSTLYSTIIGEHHADSGKIFLKNIDISEKPIHERAKAGIGYLSQQRSVFNMSCYDNLLGVCQLSIKGAENQVAMVEKLLDEFNLQHLRNINSSVLSGGEVRRLMMARIMVNKPNLILLDEPMSALDPIVIQDIQKYILKIQSYGCAILVTDHQVRNLFDIVESIF